MQCRSHTDSRCRAAFTLIELLVVITVVLVLMGLILKAAQLANESAQRSKTQAIVGAVSNGLAAALGEGMSLPLTVHPLASTKAAITSFDGVPNFDRGSIDPIRLDPSRITLREPALGALAPYSSGAGANEAFWSSDQWSTFNGVTSAPSSTGTSLNLPILGSESFQFASASGAYGQLGARMLPNDVMSNYNAPTVYGCKRELMTVLGTPHPDLVAHITCPSVDRNGMRSQSQTRIVQLFTSITATTYPSLVVDPAGGLPVTTAVSSLAKEHTELALKRVLASTWDQLHKMGALYQPPDDDNLLWDSRLWWDKSKGRLPANSPGVVYANPMDRATASLIPAGSGGGVGWWPYRMRGMAVYDAWGRELLISQTSDQRVRIVSAGKDGYMRLSPGKDMAWNTTAFNRRMLSWATTWQESSRSSNRGLSGDDQDGTRDNVSIGIEPRDYYDILTGSEAAFFGVSE